ncbi:ATP-binding cassette domain-containing protein [Lapidilactobacillus gannanensis]|uniref:ATP-binding cassette domain-containing protein n=1 Tax=Lapidilactobacillus gannanensis TaxID=2486002 RepID=A0ABW4BM81_9LACO
MAPSGSGKTTLLNIIFDMLVDYQGQLLVDGQDYHQLSESAIQARMLYVDQHPYIFSATLRENILMGRPASAAQLQEICDICGVNEFLPQLDNGLDTMLRHGGDNLSGGQMQRIAMARMLLSDRPILLLDEITSALDAKTALRIEQKILSQTDKTIIMVTHNLHDEIRPLVDQTVDFAAI